jgi:hypothetical protein
LNYNYLNVYFTSKNFKTNFISCEFNNLFLILLIVSERKNLFELYGIEVSYFINDKSMDVDFFEILEFLIKTSSNEIIIVEEFNNEFENYLVFIVYPSLNGIDDFSIVKFN